MAANSLLRTQTVRKEQPITSNRYSLAFTGLDVLLERAYSSGGNGLDSTVYNRVKKAFEIEFAGTTSPEKMLELALLSVTIPPVEVDAEDLSRFNDSTRVLTKFSPMGDVSCTFYDYINGSATAILIAWQTLVANKRTGAIGWKEDYILEDALFQIFGPDAPQEVNPTVYQEFAVKNLYPRTIDFGEHNYETGAIRRVTVNFIIDNFYPSQDFKNSNARTRATELA